jgi:hypothetical protein
MAERTPPDQPQKSEVHATTEDASTSPANRDMTTKSDPDRSAPQAGTALPEEKTFDEREKTFPEDVRVRRDESDEGGPIEVEMDEP